MQQLVRRLGVPSAVGIGLASMLGAGVFFVWSPAAAAAGDLLLVSLGIAAVVACANALSTAQLAMAHPVSGGAYTFGRRILGPRAGFAAGWLFLWGKSASAGAIALVAGGYLWPDASRPVAAVAVAVFAVLNMTGVRATAAVSMVLAAVVLTAIVVFAIAVLLAPTASAGPRVAAPAGPYGVLQGAALIFFAFAGYARMATLGEEVRAPRRTLPTAIVTALAIVLVVYAVVAGLCVALLGPVALAGTASPLAELLGGGWELVIRLAAGLACLGSLVGILAALSRTGLAMARTGDLPGPLARVSRRGAPAVAEATTATLALLGVLLLEPRAMVALSSCAVLGYYAIANTAALRQPAPERWLPRAVPALGLVGCAALAVSLPPVAVGVTAVVLAAGLGLREVRAGRVRPGAPDVPGAPEEDR